MSGVPIDDDSIGDPMAQQCPNNPRAAGRGALNVWARPIPRRSNERIHGRAFVNMMAWILRRKFVYLTMDCDHQHPIISDIEQLQLENARLKTELNIMRYSDAHGFLRTVYGIESDALQELLASTFRVCRKRASRSTSAMFRLSGSAIACRVSGVGT